MNSPVQGSQAEPGVDAAEAATPPGDLGAAALPAPECAGQPASAPEPMPAWSPQSGEPQGGEPQSGEPQAGGLDATPAPAGSDDLPPEGTADVDHAARDLDRTLDALTALHDRIGDLAEAAAELTRLRSRDTELIARLHDDVTRLRNGEIASALNPVVSGMVKLHDQMVSLGALADPASPVGMLHTQLLQVLELTCAIRPFTPVPGERFDASRHTGMKRVPTVDPAADGTVAGTIRVGFARADGSVVRVAEVEVHRLSG